MIDKDIKMKEKHMRLERHIVWSTDMIDLNDPWQRKWYIQQVLTYGRSEDIVKLNWDEIRMLLGDINLPSYVKSLWESYFNAQR